MTILIAEVIARIHAALRRAHPADEKGRRFTMDDLTIHPDALLARRESKPIELTRREVLMLELLHRHAAA